MPSSAIQNNLQNTMRRYRDLPLQKKISLIVIIGMVSAICITVAYFISFDRDNVKRDLREEMSVLARITAARSAVALAFGDRSNALENLDTLSLRSTVQYACIYNESYTLFAQYQRENSRFSGCAEHISIDQAPFYSDNPHLIEVIEPIYRRGVQLGYVLVASDLSPIEKRTRKWLVTSFFVTLAALIFAFLMTRQMQYSVVRPILELANLMDGVRSGNDLSLRAKVYNQDEVGRLVSSFNEMLEILEEHNQDLERLYRDLVDKSAEAESTAASLEARNNHMKTMFGSAAHDLRQPLQAMTIFVDTLKRKIHDQEHLDVVSKLKQAVSNLSQLFTEILDVSRYEFDFSSAELQPVSVKQLLGKLFMEFDAMAQDKGLELRFRSVDQKVYAHTALLERIIRNLLSNAIRYTDQGGILVGCRVRGANLSIEVWDTGCGIPEHKKPHIFSKFVQVNMDDREAKGGFGLGLAIVKQFADSLGYELTVESTVGKGTVFRVLVPLVDSNTPQGAEMAASQSAQALEKLPQQTLDILHDHSETRILLVDDDEILRAALKLTLQDWGFVVDDFADISSMLGFYRQGGPWPNIMISDYQLGENTNGHQALQALQGYLHVDIPAFILSASEDESVLQEIQNSGLQFLQKPVKPARLRAMINHLLP